MEWRYIPAFCAPGAVQMAVDSWMFHQCQQGLLPPTLRFYTWFPGTVSLGHFQRCWPDAWSTLCWKGSPLTIVRRPSGGRAVLHQGDLTYSLVTNTEGQTRQQVYQMLCQFLITGWQHLGVSLKFGESGRGYHEQTNCFKVSTSADLVNARGAKFVGSAQLWRGKTVLQHGSMALQPEPQLEKMVFDLTDCVDPLDIDDPKEAWKGLIEPMSIPFATIISTLITAAENELKIQLIPQPLSNSEWKSVNAFLPKTQVLKQT